MIYLIAALIVSLIVHVVVYKRLNVYKHMALRDPLTGIYNRRSFYQQLESLQELKERHGTPYSVILLDVDDFKAFNDNFGHETGDKVLMHITNLVQRQVRLSDHVCRIGGEEIAILLPMTSLSQARPVAYRIKKAVAKNPFNGRKVTVSGGVAESRANETHSALMNRVDALLYEAKAAGKNRMSS